MLEQVIIWLSTSPFSTLVLLVNKAEAPRVLEGYHALNDKTSKDKFPIPMFEELLDELHGTN